jgi:NtrC-family two-component system response regulator AlgB
MAPQSDSGAMRVLIIDDEENIRRATALVVETMGHTTAAAADGASALKQVQNGDFELAFLDLRLNQESGLDLLPELLKANPRLEIVVFTAYASIETAVEAMRRGAVDYVPKPFTPEQIRRVLTRILKARKLEDRVAELESRLSSDAPAIDLTTSEPAMQKAIDLALKTATTPATILLLGESGTGKTVLARAIHARSPQKDNPFVTVNCPNLSRELLESELFGHVKGSFTGAVNDAMGKVAAAEGGTLFLDEIGELPLEIQPKLLRLLQEKEYERIGEAKTRRANVRVISATNRDLEQKTREGGFREDLFYRLNVISIQVPALRERLRDLPQMAESYLQFFARQCGKKIKGLSKEAEQVLLGYAWPGNLRELRNVIERAVILAAGQQVGPDDLPDKISLAPEKQAAGAPQPGAMVSLEELENEHIARVMERAGTMEEAAKILGIDPATLYRRRKKMSLETGESASPPIPADGAR